MPWQQRAGQRARGRASGRGEKRQEKRQASEEKRQASAEVRAQPVRGVALQPGASRSCLKFNAASEP